MALGGSRPDDDVTRIHVAGPGEAKAPAPTFATVMPGSERRNAAEIKAASPEKEPGDPKTGPGGMYAFMGVCAAALAVMSLVLAIWIGWAGAAMAAGFGVLALAFNPEIVATFNRAGERRRILEERGRHDAGDEA